MALKENVATYDELDMATTRLRLRLPDEPVPETLQPNILEPMEVSHNYVTGIDGMVTMGVVPGFRWLGFWLATTELWPLKFDQWCAIPWQ